MLSRDLIERVLQLPLGGLRQIVVLAPQIWGEARQPGRLDVAGGGVYIGQVETERPWRLWGSWRHYFQLRSYPYRVVRRRVTQLQRS